MINKPPTPNSDFFKIKKTLQIQITSIQYHITVLNFIKKPNKIALERIDYWTKKLKILKNQQQSQLQRLRVAN